MDLTKKASSEKFVLDIRCNDNDVEINPCNLSYMTDGMRCKLQTAPDGLVAQARPVKPEAHVHENPLPCNTRRELPPIAAVASTHVPPLRHGRDAHAEPGAQRSHVFAQ